MSRREAMRHAVAMTLLAAVACAVPSGPPGPAPASTEKRLSFYSFPAYVPADLLVAFEKKTGIAVTLGTYETNEEMIDALTARPEAYDVIVPSDYAVEILVRRRALRALDLAQIPHHTNVDPAFLTPYFDPGPTDKYSLPYRWGTTGIAYDRTKVSPPPTAWADLWRPDLAGRIVLLDDAREMIGIALLVMGKDKNTREPAEIEAAGRKLEEMTKGALAFDANQGEAAFASGEASVGVLFSGNATLAQRRNPNVDWVLPAEGPGLWFDNLAVPATSPHPAAAHAFIDFLLVAENAGRMGERFPYSTPNTAALAWMEANTPDEYTAYRQSPISNPSPVALSKGILVRSVDPKASSLYEQAWGAAKAARRR